MKAILSYFQQHYTLMQLGEITWAHGVNSQERLQRALADPQVMVIESDIRVSLGGDIIAAHPPRTESDLRLDELLETVQATRQGLKLDFKDAASVLPGLQQLCAYDLQRPVLLNADILQGIDAPSPAIQADEFLQQCAHLYPRGILSIGWTTVSDPLAMYTSENVAEMLAVCQKHHLQHVTFPVRATYLPRSWENVTRLLQPDGYSLTIWEGRPLSPGLAHWLRAATDPAQACYDCRDEHGASFRFDQ